MINEEEYLKWKKEKNVLTVVPPGGANIPTIVENPDGTVRLVVMNDRKDIKVGDYYGGKKVLEISCVGKYLECLAAGWKGIVLLEGWPIFHIYEDPEKS